MLFSLENRVIYDLGFNVQFKASEFPLNIGTQLINQIVEEHQSKEWIGCYGKGWKLIMKKIALDCSSRLLSHECKPELMGALLVYLSEMLAEELKLFKQGDLLSPLSPLSAGYQTGQQLRQDQQPLVRSSQIYHKFLQTHSILANQV
jgi:hypothetical protein